MGQGRHGAPALTLSIYPWSQGSCQACSISLLCAWACTMRWRPRILLLGIPAWPPESGGCNARCALLQSVACAYYLRGIAASQDLHDGGLSCHVPPVPGPTAKLASSLSSVVLQSIRPVTLNCHCAITASPPGSAEHPTSLPCVHPARWTRMPSIR